MVGGFDEAAAVDELALIALVWVELTGKARQVPGSPSWGGEGLVSDEESMPDGDAPLG